MLKTLMIVLMMGFLLVACNRGQQNANVVTESEVPSDFTTQPQPPESNNTTPELPGRAQILGAPFPDVSTQTGTATVLPSQLQTVEVPESDAQSTPTSGP